MVSGGQFRGRFGGEQGLYSTASHEYTIWDGGSGDALSTIEAPGMMGTTVACSNSDPASITIASGSSRRFDISTLALDGTPLWRQAIFMDPTPPGMTAGTETIAFTARCQKAQNDTTLFGANLHHYSHKRGEEVISPSGLIIDQGSQLGWISPPLMQQSSALPSLELHDRSGSSPWSSTGAAPVAGATIAGTTVGLLSILRADRKLRRGGGKP